MARSGEIGVWNPGDCTELRDTQVFVANTMTDYELEKDLDRAERLLDELDGYPVHQIVAYGSMGRVGVQVAPGHDPLNNGVITSNIDGFRVDAVRPDSSNQVRIRFQDESVVEG